MTKAVLSAIGEDAPGIVSAVTGILLRHHASIEDSTMTILEGHFAMIMIVSWPTSSNLTRLQTQFHVVEKKFQLITSIREFSIQPRIGSETHKGTPYIVSVFGSDKPGIVHHVSKFLASQKISITDLNSKVIGKEGGKNVYALVMEIETPLTQSISKLKNFLKKIERRLKVEIKIKPLESFTL